MEQLLNPLLLARIQFAFTVSFHIIFPAFTIGLASFLAMVEFLWLATKNNTFRDIYKFWVKIFAVAFGMGVVSGVTMSYQFGTNWSSFADKTANVLGPLLGYEVLTAFFLESSFLGIMLFGWGRVSKNMHFTATCIVAGGTLLSAFWILSANSFMQTPAGFYVQEDGRLMPTNWLDIIFNPSFPYRFLHMITAAYLTTSFVIGGVSAFYLITKRHIKEAKIMFFMSVLMAFFVSPIQLFIGHEHGINTMIHQPAKVAAMEGNWDHANHAPLYLFGIPNQALEKTEYGITIPGLASWVLTGSFENPIPKLKSFAKEDIPPVFAVFWSFRVMVGIGVLMIFTGLFSAAEYARGRLYTNKFLHYLWVLMSPSGFVAILAGWFVSEIGRQPWVVYGVLRTSDGVSPAIIGPQVAWSLLCFVVIYLFVFGSGSFYVLRLISKGIIEYTEDEQFYKRGVGASVVESGLKKKL
ncbi:MAG: cytochrome ubiquinol oxidase subunit I [Rickettsiaceae bacterium]|nr:cytochrome ubiquinol oxidase subunit I [Rickettsiaceae bacterium]